jgi:hypothetical protein
MSTLRTALVALVSLSACSTLSGESETIDLYNPDTGEVVKCGGYGVHRGSPTTTDEVDRCIKEHERKGFRPYANADAQLRRVRADQ